MKRIFIYLFCVVLFVSCTEEPQSTKIATIELSEEEVIVVAGDNVSIIADLIADGPGRINDMIEWSSSNENIAKVVDLGMECSIVGISPGESIITAKSPDGPSATCKVTVVAKVVPVTGITLNKSWLEILENRSATLTAFIKPSDATNTEIIWSSTDENIATVNDGIVRGIKPGRTKIVAETVDGGFTDECDVTVTKDYQSQSKGPITLKLGNVTASTVTLFGTLDVDQLGEYDMDDGGVGFIYTTTNTTLNVNSAKKVKITTVGADNDFSFSYTGLPYDTRYHYTIFLYKNGVCQYGSTQYFKTEDVDITVDEVTAGTTTATFKGTTSLLWGDRGEINVGIQYSKNENLSNSTKINLSDSTETFEYIREDLNYNTKYYYRTYIEQDGSYKYGDTQDFMTQSISVTVGVDNITQTTAIFSGSVDLAGGEGIGVGVRYWEVNGDGTIKKSVTNVIDEDGNYSVKVEGLKPDTQYRYSYYTYQNNSYIYGETKNFTTGNIPLSVSVNDITQTTATFTGNISLTEKDVLEVGLLYSSSASDPKATTNGVNKVVLTDIMDADGNYSHKAEGLLNETTHYYRYYVKQGSTYTYGDVMNFKTNKVPVTIAVESIDKNVVTFKGNVQFSELGAIELGIQYYPKSITSQSEGIQTKAVTEISENGDFTLEISRLLSATEYYWQYYLLQNGVTVVGSPQTFAIADLYKGQSDLNLSSAVDLSSSEPANCYIVSEAGLYKFMTVKGNGSESVGSVASAEILWETFGTSTAPEILDLIEALCYKDGYIAFQTADTFKEGNALIAAKDAAGTILWSWHIWFTDEPQGQVYNNDAGTMMDRNLGATSATPGEVGALGLLYQWGRKDPFLGSSSISSSTLAKSTITWPSSVSSTSSTGTIEYATANPTTFITYNSSNYDWYYTGSSSTDNTRWTTSGSVKSIYDPCPAGWRVPDGGSSGVWSKAGFDDTTSYDSTNKGKSFSISSPSTTWYPASGCRYGTVGGLGLVGYYGGYWSASPYGGSAYNVYFNGYGYVNPSYYDYRAYGQSVRCLQESK